MHVDEDLKDSDEYDDIIQLPDLWNLSFDVLMLQTPLHVHHCYVLRGHSGELAPGLNMAEHD